MDNFYPWDLVNFLLQMTSKEQLNKSWDKLSRVRHAALELELAIGEAIHEGNDDTFDDDTFLNLSLSDITNKASHRIKEIHELL